MGSFPRRPFWQIPLMLLALAGATAPASTALAQPKKPPPSKNDPRLGEAKKLFDQGASAYAQGSYDEAIKAWEKAYELSQKPLIFESIANAYERLGDAKKARDYLIKWRDSAPKEETELLDSRIKNLDARVTREEQAAADRKAADDKANQDRDARDAAARQADEEAKSKAWLPGAIVTGVGGAAVIAGIALDIVASSKRPASDVCKTSGGATLCKSSAQSGIESSNRFATVGDALWIAGAAAVAGGVVLILVRKPPKASDAGAPAAPPPPPAAYLAPYGPGLMLGGSF